MPGADPPRPRDGGAEPDAVKARYARRAQAAPGAIDRYSFLQPDVWRAVQERQRAMLRLFRALGWTTLADKTVLEVGSGSGGNLLELLRLGFAPQHLAGIELLPERFAQARAALPEAVTLHLGDALAQALPAGQADIVLQSTVFSSLLDEDFQQRLAAAMWRWVKPGGGVLWYDFAVNNPRNPDVRGVPMARVQELFPQAQIQAWRVTLAPPLARRVAHWPAMAHGLLAAVPWLRTHRLAWLAKPSHTFAPDRP